MAQSVLIGRLHHNNMAYATRLRLCGMRLFLFVGKEVVYVADWRMVSLKGDGIHGAMAQE